MRLKSFQAKTMSEAMRLVKETLGDDAIIVSTREESGTIRITAAIEQMPEKPAPQPVTETPEMDDDEIATLITDTLLRHRVPGSVSDKLISTAMIMATGDAQKTLAKAIEKTFRFASVADSAEKPLILVGPPGAGKTLMTAKLATRAVMDGRKPVIITTDIARAGGVEQLTAFLNILELPLRQADDPKALAAILQRCGKKDTVIIDTGGLNPFDPQEMKHLARLMAVTEMESALVLPAGIDAEESAEMALTFDVLGVRRLIPTRLDFARRIGGILSAADKAGLIFGEASHTAQVANGITMMDALKLAAMLLPQAEAQKQMKRGKS